MAKCEFCDKGVAFGIKVSHSHRRSNRMWKPNVKRVKAIVDGTPKHVYVCTRCLRAERSPGPSEVVRPSARKTSNEPLPSTKGGGSFARPAPPAGGGRPVFFACFPIGKKRKKSKKGVDKLGAGWYINKAVA